MDEPIPDASQTNPGNWKYISEGRSTIVFSYDGPAHPLYTGTVLRVRKFRLGLSSEARDSPSVAFHNKIISKLVKHEFLPTLRSVSVGQEWLKQLHDLEDQNRPSERRNSGSIDFLCRMAVLAKPNRIFSPGAAYDEDSRGKSPVRSACAESLYICHKFSLPMREPS